MDPRRPILGLDTASPLVSVAVGTTSELLAVRTIELRRSSELLLATIEAVLAEAGCRFGDLGGCAVLRGPGSFTGLRVGLGTALGFHQASGLALAPLPTLPVLALSLRGTRAAAADTETDTEIVAAVDALRGDWYVQRFAPLAAEPLAEPRALPRPLAEPELRHATTLARLGRCRVVGFGVGALAAQLGPGAEAIEPGPLAGWAVRFAAGCARGWDVTLATQPIYFRSPAVTLAAEERRG